MLRVLHTADWHLGQHLHGISRDYEHQQFLDWLLQQLKSQQADVLIVAGDIFDTANPSAVAQTQPGRVGSSFCPPDYCGDAVIVW